MRLNPPTGIRIVMEIGRTAEEQAANIRAMFGSCQHPTTEPVELITGEVVAAMCVNCLEALPPSWGCDDCDYVDIRQLGDRWPHRIMAELCEAHR